MNYKPEKFRAPQTIFFIYIIASSLVIMIFKFIFPGSEEPLSIYFRDWRLIQGALALFNLFPALVFSALVIPFGVVSDYEEEYQSFSEVFFKKLSVSIVLAIISAVIYGLIFFLVLPVVKNKEENMRFSGNLYRLSRARMMEHRERGEWREAAEFLRICDKIWYINDDKSSFVDKGVDVFFVDVRIDIHQKLDQLRALEIKEREEARASLARDFRSASLSTLTGGVQPVNAAQAMNMARTAFTEKRYFDAHWLANLAGRLAVPGSPETTTSAKLASDAWNEISSLAPNSQEERKYRLFALKLEGYKAMEAGEKGNNHEWIRAYYIFKDLAEYDYNNPDDLYDPDDPDIKNFLAASEIGAKQTAFFIDEIELSLGDTLTGAVFSLPDNGSRVVMRFSSLTTGDDLAYGVGLEYMSFDINSRPTASVTSRYAKLTPIILDGESKVLILMHALDRDDENRNYNAEYLFGIPAPGGIILNTDFESILLLSDVRRNISNLQMDELFDAANKFDQKGYIPEVFQAEILNRIASALFFLPMAIFIIVLGWRYRTHKRPRYLFSVMLFVLPVVFNGFVFIYRSLFNTLGIWLVLSIGFAGALTIFIVLLAVSLFLSLITLAAQHS